MSSSDQADFAGIQALGSRAAGYAVAQKCLEVQAAAEERDPSLKTEKRVILHDDARSWFVGALGEMEVGRMLSALGAEWFVRHAVPIGAGTYFRCLPFGSIRRRFADHAESDTAIVGYFHPYDIDTAQERVMSRGVNGSRVLNSLLYFNRGGTLRRLESILDAGFRIMPYRDFIPMLSHA